MPSRLKLRPRATPATPEADTEVVFLDEADGVLKSIDDTGTVTNLGSGTSGGGLTVDNQSDPPAEVTTLIAPGADLSTPGQATFRIPQVVGPLQIEHDTAGFATGTGALLMALDPGDVVLDVTLYVYEAFDGSTSSFSVGFWEGGVRQQTMAAFAVSAGDDRAAAISFNNPPLSLVYPTVIRDAGITLRAQADDGSGLATGDADVYVQIVKGS